MILEQTERMSQQVNSAVRGQQMSDTELDLTARAAEEVLSTVMRARKIKTHKKQRSTS